MGRKQETFSLMWETTTGVEFFQRITPKNVYWTRNPEMATQLTKKHAGEIAIALNQLNYPMKYIQLVKVTK